jgi:hypothetical protein
MPCSLFVPRRRKGLFFLWDKDIEEGFETQPIENEKKQQQPIVIGGESLEISFLSSRMSILCCLFIRFSHMWIDERQKVRLTITKKFSPLWFLGRNNRLRSIKVRKFN